MKLGQKISTGQFIFSQILILIIGFGFVFGLYYLLNYQDQKPAGIFSNGPLTTAPKSLKLDLDQPAEDVLTFTPSIIVSGQTAPAKNVLISQDTTDSIILSSSDGSFSTVVNLNKGVNKITVVVFDSDGDSRSLERTVYFSEEKL